MNTKVDLYLENGCGRCEFYQTPKCKVHNWTEELNKLRIIMNDSGLSEDFKWSQPCYTYKGKNVLILAAFKNYCAVSFFKGALLKDSKGLLTKPGDNSQAIAQFRFTNTQDIVEMEPILREYICEAIEIEKSGLKIDFKKDPEPIPEEFQKKLNEMPDLRAAFEALTPGKQRAYILHFSAPKKSKTRENRIEKFIPQILEGKAFYV